MIQFFNHEYNNWNSLKVEVADLPPVGCFNQWGMSPKDSQSEIPVAVLFESKSEKKC